MASQIPDPRTFDSWEDAFQYPIPAVGGMERKLRTNIRENQEKLRTLVGASYRDLLGTARTIVDADKQMHQVEELLVDLGRRSDSRILEKISNNQARMSKDQSERDSKRVAFAAQMQLLQKSLSSVANLLKEHGSLLLAAKIILMARSLHRTLGRDSEAPLLVKLGNRLGSLRQRLLRALDRRFAVSGEALPEIASNMTAYCLVTSSTAGDAAQHFLDARLRVLEHLAESTEEPVAALKLFTDTLDEITAVMPRTIAEMVKVRDGYLFDDAEIWRKSAKKMADLSRYMFPETKFYRANLKTEWDTECNPFQQAWLMNYVPKMVAALLKANEQILQMNPDAAELIGKRRVYLRHMLTWAHHTELSLLDVLPEIRQQYLTRLAEISSTLNREYLRKILESIETSLQIWLNDTSNQDVFPTDPGQQNLDLSSMPNVQGIPTISDQHLGALGRIKSAIASIVAAFAAEKGLLVKMEKEKYEDDVFETDSGVSEEVQEEVTTVDAMHLREQYVSNNDTFFAKLEEGLGGLVRGHGPITGPGSAGIFLMSCIKELRFGFGRELCGGLVGEMRGEIVGVVVEKFAGFRPAPALAETPAKIGKDVAGFLVKVESFLASFGGGIWEPQLQHLLGAGLWAHIEKEWGVAGGEGGESGGLGEVEEGVLRRVVAGGDGGEEGEVSALRAGGEKAVRDAVAAFVQRTRGQYALLSG